MEYKTENDEKAKKPESPKPLTKGADAVAEARDEAGVESDVEVKAEAGAEAGAEANAKDICRICLKCIHEPCGECDALLSKCRCLRDCRIAKGTCEHMFHNHCLFPWLAKSRLCPVDFNEWEFQQ